MTSESTRAPEQEEGDAPESATVLAGGRHRATTTPSWASRTWSRVRSAFGPSA